MPRPTTKPRISALDPTAMRRDIEERIDRYLGRLAAPLSPGITFERHGDSGVALTVEALAEYAQRGLPVSDWETHGEARDAIQEVLETLYSSPVQASASSGGVGPLGEDEAGAQLGEADLDDPLSLVLVAAWARVQLADGEGLTARQLGALAGLDPKAVQLLAREGELTLVGIRPAQASAEEARRWLGSRGIRGL